MIVLVMRPGADSSPVRVVGGFESRQAALAWIFEHPRAMSGFSRAEARRIEPPTKYE